MMAMSRFELGGEVLVVWERLESLELTRGRGHLVILEVTRPRSSKPSRRATRSESSEFNAASAKIMRVYENAHLFRIKACQYGDVSDSISSGINLGAI
jgi:hypothetical protein